MMTNLNELKCPTCGKMLTSTEYNAAIEGFRKATSEEYSVRFEKYKKEFEDQMLEQQKKHRAEIEYLKIIHCDQARQIQQQLQTAQEKQIEDIKKSYNELSRQRETEFSQRLQQTLISHKKELDERRKQLQLIQQRESQFKAEAIEAARSSVKIEIIQKDQQINRFREKIEALEKQLTTTQSELKGEAGELDLLDDLQKAFGAEGDLFSRQRRGISQGDIMHKIRMPSGAFIETPIVYDNKVDKNITKNDREKAKYYRENHNTDHLIVVLNHLPREIKNGCIGRKDGILIVRRDVVMEVARQIRSLLIQISRLSANKQHQATKQSKLYDYIGSREFCRQMETICESDAEESELQKKEEKDHLTLWKSRKAIQDKRRNAYVSISSALDAITQEKPQIEDYSCEREKVLPLDVINVKGGE
jgi:hypothetical protein